MMMPANDSIFYESDIPFYPQSADCGVIYCSDGRFRNQVDDFLTNGLNLARYDCLVIPGGPGCLAGHFAAFREEEASVEQIRFLIEHHELRQIVLVAHEDCGFYKHRLKSVRSDMELQQREDLLFAARRIRTWKPTLEVNLFFAHQNNDRVSFEWIQEG